MLNEQEIELKTISTEWERSKYIAYVYIYTIALAYIYSKAACAYVFSSAHGSNLADIYVYNPNF